MIRQTTHSIAKIIALAAAAALLITVSDVQATGAHEPKPAPVAKVELQQQQAQDQHQRMHQAQTANGGASSALGGSNSLTERNSMYVFPAPVYATPLPANLCPKGDSLAWSIGWNFFSYASSTTRSEIECLERWVEINRISVAPSKPAVAIMIPPKPKPAARRKVVHPCCRAWRPTS